MLKDSFDKKKSEYQQEREKDREQFKLKLKHVEQQSKEAMDK